VARRTSEILALSFLTTSCFVGNGITASPPSPTTTVMNHAVPLPGYVAVVQGIVTIPAGQADGSDDPACPPAKCINISIGNIPDAHHDVQYLHYEMFYSELNPHGPAWQVCPMAVNIGISRLPRWDCQLYARFDNFGWGTPSNSTEGGASVRFRNWANRGRYAMLQINYWVHLDVCKPDFNYGNQRAHVICAP
jgi:hypothetical protein